MKKQSGFTVIEIIMALAIVGLIGVVGWQAVSKHQASTKTSSNSAASISPTPSPDAYAGWKTYTSEYQHVSFKYPSAWQLDAQDDFDGPPAQVVSLASPGGLTLTYRDNVQGLGGACPPGRPDVILTGVEPVSLPGATKPMYIVSSGDQIALDSENPAPQVGDVGECLFYPLFSGNVADTSLDLTTSVQFPEGTPPKVTASQTADLAAAKLILKSFNFKQ